MRRAPALARCMTQGSGEHWIISTPSETDDRKEESVNQKRCFELAIGVLLVVAVVSSVPSMLKTTDAQVSPIPTHTPTDIPFPMPPTPTNTPPPPTPTPATVPNEPPTIVRISPPENPVSVGTGFGVTVEFSDPGGEGDAPYTCSIDYDDGSAAEASTVSVSPCEGTHTYTEAGVYTLHVTVADKHGALGSADHEFVVAHDPSGGFVTGGGWIDSPAGACKNTPCGNPDATGQATFGFVSRYRKGSSRPTGNTVFQFKVADLNFHSDTYDWLVVNQDGTNAQFRGAGTINGASTPHGDLYRFMIWATDGRTSEAQDTFRIRIWVEDEASGMETDVYDNGSRQAVAGGDITVHRPSTRK
jgi:hypothetical protein